MSKRKNKGQQTAPHATRSFEQMVADATSTRLKEYIQDQIRGLAQGLMARQQQGFANSALRTVAIEELLMDKLGVTKDDLANKVAVVQDRSEGFDPVDGAVELGDRTRLEIRTKTSEQTEYAGTSRLLVDNTGSGNTLGKELEAAVLGMKVGETREVLFGKDNSLQASITVQKVSRQPKPEPTETKEESDLTEAAIGDGSEGAAKEAPNASPDAG